MVRGDESGSGSLWVSSLPLHLSNVSSIVNAFECCIFTSPASVTVLTSLQDAKHTQNSIKPAGGGSIRACSMVSKDTVAIIVENKDVRRGWLGGVSITHRREVQIYPLLGKEEPQTLQLPPSLATGDIAVHADPTLPSSLYFVSGATVLVRCNLSNSTFTPLHTSDSEAGRIKVALGMSSVCVYSSSHTGICVYESERRREIEPTVNFLQGRAHHVGVKQCKVTASGLHVLLTDGGLFRVDVEEWTLVAEGVVCFDVSSVSNKVLFATRNNRVVHPNFVRAFDIGVADVAFVSSENVVRVVCDGNVALDLTETDPDEALKAMIERGGVESAVEALSSLPRDVVLLGDVVKILFSLVLGRGKGGGALEVFDRASKEDMYQLLTEANNDFTLAAWRALAERFASKHGDAKILGKLNHYLHILARPGSHDKNFYQPNFALFLTVPRSLVLTSLARKGDLCGINHLLSDGEPDDYEWLGDLDWASVGPQYISGVIPPVDSVPTSLGPTYAAIRSVEVARELIKLGYPEFQDKVLVFDALRQAGIDIDEDLGALDDPEGVRGLVERALGTEPDLVSLLKEYNLEICRAAVRKWMRGVGLERATKAWVRDVLGDSYDDAVCDMLFMMRIEEEQGGVLWEAASKIGGDAGTKIQRALTGLNICRKWNFNNHPTTVSDFLKLEWTDVVDLIFQGFLTQGYEMAVNDILKDVSVLFEEVYGGEVDYGYVSSKLAPLSVRGGDVEGVERMVAGGGLDTVKEEVLKAIDGCNDVEGRLFSNVSKVSGGLG